jgi:hypothetical protein
MRNGGGVDKSPQIRGVVEFQILGGYAICNDPIVPETSKVEDE